MTLSASRKGDIAELFVAQYFMKEGYDVFRNLGCDGPVDLIIHHRETDTITKLDIKSVQSVSYLANGEERVFKDKCGLRSDGTWLILYVHADASLRLPDGLWEALEGKHTNE